MNHTPEERAAQLVEFGPCDCGQTEHMEGCPADGLTMGKLTRRLLECLFRAAVNAASWSWRPLCPKTIVRPKSIYIA